MKTTGNIYLAACYLCLGATLVSVDKSDIRHQRFVFFVDESMDQIELDFANRVLMVNAVEYRDAIQRIKAIIHNS